MARKVTTSARSTTTTKKVKTLLIELRGVKYAAFASEETPCFQAKVYINGMQVGTAENQGRGGPTMILPRALAARLDVYGAKLPKSKLDMGNRTVRMKQDAESLIGDLLSTYLIERDFIRASSHRIMFTIKSQPGKIFQTKPFNNVVALATLLDDPKLLTKLQGDI